MSNIQPLKDSITARDHGNDWLWASVEGRVATLSDEEAIFHRYDNGEAHVMTLDVLRAMGQCKQFDTRASHIQRILRELPDLADNSDAVSRMFDVLIQRGLIESADSVISAASTLTIETDMDAICEVFLLSYGDSDRLKRIVEHWVADPDVQGTRLTLLPMDGHLISDSDRAGLEQTLDSANIQLMCLSADWLTRIESECDRMLHEAGIESQSSDEEPNPALMTARWMNAVLLLTAGLRCLILDSRFDVTPKLLPHSRMDQVQLRNPPLYPAEFIPDDSLLDDALSNASEGLISLCNRCLGQSVSSLLTESVNTDLISLKGMTWLALNEAVIDQQVVSLQLGSVGDSRLDSTLAYYTMPWQMSAALRIDEKHYRSLLNRPRLVEAYPLMQLSDRGKYMPMAIDNRQMVPPFSGGDEDLSRLWHSWLTLVRSDSRVLNLPAMLQWHRPRTGESPYAEEYVPSFNRFLAELADQARDQIRAELPEQRLESLAAVYRDLQSASDQTLIRLVREYHGYLRSGILRQLQQQLTSAAEVPQFWYDDVTEWITVHGSALRESSCPMFLGWPQTSDQQLADRIRDELDSVITCLEGWSNLWHGSHGRMDSLLSL